MKDGFLKVACANIDTAVCDCLNNVQKIKNVLNSAQKDGVKLIAFPELCVTGATCKSLFLQEALLDATLYYLTKIVKVTDRCDMVVCVGLPLLKDNSIYNCVAVISNGEILGIVPKEYLSVDERKYFSPAPKDSSTVEISGKAVPFGKDLIFTSRNMQGFSFGVEIGSEMLSALPYSNHYVANDANIIVNCGAMNDFSDTLSQRKELIKAQSKRLCSAYLFANAGISESTSDCAFAGQCIIVENGELLNISPPFENSFIQTELDLELIKALKLKKNENFKTRTDCRRVYFDTEISDTNITRTIRNNPFIPDNTDRSIFLQNILTFQSLGLQKRIRHINAKKVIIGISGGLDSTLALLVCVKTLRRLNRDIKDIIAISMPCFGTGKKTRENAAKLCDLLGVDFREISISEEATLHLNTIGCSVDKHDVTFENAQARIRTLVLMDIANKENGIVIGTGDLSELALGWCTYNGDHMSMYSVNASVPKTLAQEIIKNEISICKNKELASVLSEIVKTPISPELLPQTGNDMSQKTEDLIGPYELHDFFIYYALFIGLHPRKIFRMACIAFEGKYSKAIINKWLTSFYKRLFSQSFKRACLPDSVKVTELSFSPVGGFTMPSDAVCRLWVDEITRQKDII